MPKRPWPHVLFPEPPRSRRERRKAGAGAGARRRSAPGVQEMEARVLLDGATITVNNPTDVFSQSTLNLRQAIAVAGGGLSYASLTPAQQAQVSSPTIGTGPTINFDPKLDNSTITLMGVELPPITSGMSLTIDGPGSDLLTIDGDSASRVFEVDSGGSLDLSGVTLTSGNGETVSYASQPATGGAILNAGTLTLTDVTVSDSMASSGGGITNSGSLVLINSTVTGNTADNGGGVDNPGDLDLFQSTVSSNGFGEAPTTFGGGLLNSGTTTIEGGSFQSNMGQFGAGINNQAAGILTVTGTTFDGNSAVDNGGAIENQGHLAVSHSAFTNNNASVGGGLDVAAGAALVSDTTVANNQVGLFSSGTVNVPYGGAGAVASGATLALINDTITGNSASNGSFAGIADGGTVNAGNSIVAGNQTGDIFSESDPAIGGPAGAFNDLGTNLFGTVSYPTPGPGDQSGAPNLDTLGDHGGPTATMPPLTGSPAIGNGNTALVVDANDQRGYARVVAGATDIGAVESEAAPAVGFIDLSGSADVEAAPGDQVTYTMTVANNTGLAQPDAAVADTIPDGTTLVSWTSSDPSWALTAPAVGGTGAVTASTASLAPGAMVTFTLVVQVDADLTVGTDIHDTMSVGPVTDVDSANFSLEFDTTTVAPTPAEPTPMTVVVGPDTPNADFSNVDVPLVIIVDSSPVPLVVTGGKVDNTFVEEMGQVANATLIGGPADSVNTFDVAPSDDDHIKLVDGGGTNTVNIADAVLPTTGPAKPGEAPPVVGATLDLTRNGGQVQYVYQPGLLNPDVAAFVSPGLVAADSTSSLSLQGQFQYAVAGNAATLYAAPASADLAAQQPGTTVILAGTGNTVYGAAGSVVQAFSGGNNVVQKSDPATSGALNAFLGNLGAETQGYLAGTPAAQQAFLQQDSTAIAQYLASVPTSLQAFLTANPASTAQFLATNTAAVQAFLVPNTTAVAQFLTTNLTSQQAFLAANTPAVAQFLATSPTAAQAFLQANTPAVAQFLATSPTAAQAFLQANTAGVSAYVASNPTVLSAFNAYVLAHPGATAQNFLAANPVALSAFLTSSPTAIGAYLGANPSALQAYLVQNAAGVAQFVLANPTAQQAFLAANAPAISQYVVDNPAGRQAFLAANSAGVSAFIASVPTALAAFEAANPGAAGFLAPGGAGLQAFLTANPGALQAFLVANPATLSAFLAGSPTAIQAYLAANPPALQAYLQQNAVSVAQFLVNVPTATQAYLQADAAGLSAFLVSSPTALSAFVTGNPVADQAFLQGGVAAVQAFLLSNAPALQQFLGANPALLQQYLATNPPALQQFLAANPALLQQFLGGNPTVLQQYLTASPAALQQYLAGNPIGLQQYLAANPGALAQYLSSATTALQQYLAGTPTALQQFLTGNPALLQQYLAGNPLALQQFLTGNPTVLQQFLSGTPAALQQFLSGAPGALQQFLAGDPAVLQQFLTANPALLQQFLGTNTAGLQQFLSASLLNLFRLKVNLPGANNQASGGLLSTFHLGSGLFTEALDPAQIQTLSQAVSTGMAADMFALNVTTDQGNNTLVGGVLSHFTALGGGRNRFIIEDASLLGAPGTVVPTAITSTTTSTFTGSGPNDTFSFVGGKGGAFGHVVLQEPGTAAGDTLDFSNVQGSGVRVNLNLTGAQTVIPRNLALTLPAGGAVTNVIGSPGNDVIIGNGKHGLLRGSDFSASAAAFHPPYPGATRVQQVYLDFTSNRPTPIPGEVGEVLHSYTAAEQLYVLQSLRRLYAAFPFIQFTTTRPTGAYMTVNFNSTPVVDGQPSPGGFSREVDFGNLNLTTTVQVDVNGFLGTAPGLVPDTTADFVNLSTLVAAHEVGHTLGLEHFDSFGPVGFGITAPPGVGAYGPAYAGPVGAFTARNDVMASPASVGSSLAAAASGQDQFGARDAITLAFIAGGKTVGSYGTDPRTLVGVPRPTVAVTPPPRGFRAQPVTLYPLYVPNPITSGFDAGKRFAVTAVDVVGKIGGTAPVLGPNGQPVKDAKGNALTVSVPNGYSFQGRAGQDMNFQAMSASITSIPNPVDTVLTVYGPNGKVVATNDDQFEPSDSSIFDLILPTTGRYVVVVSAFHSTDPTFITPGSKNYNPAAFYNAQHGEYELFMYTFAAYDATTGVDTILASAPQPNPGSALSVSRPTFTSEAGLHAVTFLGPFTPGGDNNPFAENVPLAGAVMRNRRG